MLFVVLVGVLALGLVLLFDTGQSVNKKVQLTHTADAAAYSVAVQQARVMNYAAYMNRGRVANEVAIAQMVSLWSWSNMIHTHTVAGHNFFFYLSFIPYVNVVAKPLQIAYRAAERVVAGMRAVLNPIAKTAIQVLDELNGLYALSAEQMIQLGAGTDGVLIARQVVRENDPNAEIGAVGLGVLASQLLHAASSGSNGLYDEHRKSGTRRVAGMDRYRNVVMASRDHFSADRSDEIGIPLIDIETHGGTDMVDYNRWVGLDNLDLSIGIDIGLIDLTWDAPLGWGGAQAVQNAQRQPAFFPGIQSGNRNARGAGWYSEYHPGNRTYRQYGGVSRGSVSGNNASLYPSVDAPFFVPMRPSGNLKQRRHAYLGGYGGLREYHDVKSRYGQLPEGEDAGPVFSVYVQSERRHARTSEDVDGIGGPEGGKLHLRADMPRDQMTAIATSQVYFNRAPAKTLFQRLVPRSWNGNPQSDSQLEMGSLFSPYWQARLVETPRSIYAAVGLTGIAGGG